MQVDNAVKQATIALALVATLGGWAPAAHGQCPDVLGDVNATGVADIADVQCTILAALFALSEQGQSPSCLANGALTSADVSCDAAVSVIDIQLTILAVLDLPFDASIDANADGCPDACSQESPPGACEIALTCISECKGFAECEAVCTENELASTLSLVASLRTCLTENGCMSAAGFDDAETCNEGPCLQQYAACALGKEVTQAGSCCETNNSAGCASTTCMGCVCAAQPSCCSDQWDESCVKRAATECHQACECAELNCKDATNCMAQCFKEPDPEACRDSCIASTADFAEGPAIKIRSCLSTANCFEATTVAAFSACRDANCQTEALACKSAVAVGSGSCCTANESPSCSEGDCAGCVCAHLPECCDGPWTEACATRAGGPCNGKCQCGALSCSQVLGCSANCADAGCRANCKTLVVPEETKAMVAATDCAEAAGCFEIPDATGPVIKSCLENQCGAAYATCNDPGSLDDGACCSANETPGCELVECGTCVCESMPSCCTDAWTQACVDLARKSACASTCSCSPDTCLDVYGCLNSCGTTSACESQCSTQTTAPRAAAALLLAQCAQGKGCGTFGAAGHLACLLSACPTPYQNCGVDLGEEPAGPCCAAHSEPSCEGVACTECVCEALPACCTDKWGAACSALARNECSTPCKCEPLNCKQAVACAVDSGSAQGASDCLEQAAPVAVVPAEQFVTCLQIHGCLPLTGEAQELCVTENCQAQASTCLTGEPDSTTLSCCEAHDGPGCNAATCGACVCNQRANCCDLNWDDECVALAAGTCTGVCGCQDQGPSCEAVIDCHLDCGDDMTCAAACLSGAAAATQATAQPLITCLTTLCADAENPGACAHKACPAALASCLN